MRLAALFPNLIDQKNTVTIEKLVKGCSLCVGVAWLLFD